MCLVASSRFRFLEVETLLEVRNRSLQSGFVPEYPTRQRTWCGRVSPVLTHSAVSVEVALTTRDILVLCEIAVSLLSERCCLRGTIWFYEYRIPLLLLVVTLTNGLQTQASCLHCLSITNNNEGTG
jgi:hypothetical protein